MNNYSGFEDLKVTLNTTQGVMTGTFIGYDSQTESHIMSINGEITSVATQSILGLISTENFQVIDAESNTHINVNIEPGGTGTVHFKKARAVSNIQKTDYKSWKELSSALHSSLR